MNIIRIIWMNIILLLATSLSAQVSDPDHTLRKVVFTEGQAAVVDLNHDGDIIKKVINLPDYFVDDFEDSYYIKLSYDQESTQRESQKGLLSEKEDSVATFIQKKTDSTQ